MNIILYSNDCPRCKILKQKLDEKEIAYTTCSNEEEMISKGFMIMPVLEVDGDIKNFFEAVNWIKEI